MAGQEEQVSVQFDLPADQVRKLRSSFPYCEDISEVATILADLMTNELIDLLAGEKRYMSLSHQYVEWLEQLYEAVLPGEEYTYERIYNRFNFPPGSAQYLARVLRDRQSSVLHEKAKSELLEKLSEKLDRYNELPPEDRPGAKRPDLQLTRREFDLLQTAAQQLLKSREVSESPKVTSRLKDIVVVTYHIDCIEKVLPEVRRL